MQQTDHSIKRCELCNVCGVDGDDTADQDLLDVLRSEGRTIDDQYRRSRCDDVKDSDDRLLAHGTSEVAGQCQKRRTDRSEHEGVGKARRTRYVVSVRERDTGAEGRQLRKGEIGKDNFPAQHVHTEVRMDQDEDDRGKEGKRQERERLAYPTHGFRAFNAFATVATL